MNYSQKVYCAILLTATLVINTGSFSSVNAETAVHVWEKVEITLRAENEYQNPYTEVVTWIDLTGPGFKKRCYGFWDGGNIFRVRILAQSPGEWRWESGSNQDDPGLNGQSGTFAALKWTDPELKENPARRGFIKPSANGHAFEYADGTPFILLGDTWWSASTNRFRWYDDEKERPIGPGAGFKDYIRLRKRQGFNNIALIAAFPSWIKDDRPRQIWIDRSRALGVRDAWDEDDADNVGLSRSDRQAQDMRNEGGMPFAFPGKVPGLEDYFPDINQLNPEYFKYMDRKIDYMNSMGFIPFIEVSRRDIAPAWKEYYDWPDSYVRYVQYIFSRYQANNCLLSPIHYDSGGGGMSLQADDFNIAANKVVELFGPPPFGTLVSANASPSTTVNFGDTQWLTFHQTGNGHRTHDMYWYLTDLYHAEPARPAINGEPVYAGLNVWWNKEPKTIGGSDEDNRFCRSSMYGCFLSGGFGGYTYGAQGIWAADIGPGDSPNMWEAFGWKSGDEVRHLQTFAFANGNRYRDLAPDMELVQPNRTPDLNTYLGWAYCARTAEKDYFLAYFEKECPESIIRGAVPFAAYEAQWFDPRSGRWESAEDGTLTADSWGRISLPAFPSDDDWGLQLKMVSD
jgi:hypothetical protein